MGGKVADRTGDFIRQNLFSIISLIGVVVTAVAAHVVAQTMNTATNVEQTQKLTTLESKLDHLDEAGGRFETLTRVVVDGHAQELVILKGDIKEMRAEMKQTSSALSRIEAQVDFLVDQAKKRSDQ